MAGSFIRGAFVEFIPTFLVPQPNIIVFQFNPETLTHTWRPGEGTPSSGTDSDPLAVKGVPGESFSFTLSMDAGYLIADRNPIPAGIASVSGIAAQLAALELLLYPASQGEDGLVGTVSASAPSVGPCGLIPNAPAAAQVPQSEVPAILFIWGPGRILPVRVTSLTITERLYDRLLNPTHAEAQIELRVLTPEELPSVAEPFRAIAKGAYDYSQGIRQALAALNLLSGPIGTELGHIGALRQAAQTATSLVGSAESAL